MKISTKGRYAIQLMLDLALNDNGGYISINHIAKRQSISVKYLEQIISVISKAGFVKSVRGPQGGYKLAKKPSEYTIGMILRLMEGDLGPVDSMDDGEKRCSSQGELSTLFIWQELSDAINSVVDNITLEDVLNREKENIGYEYYI